MVSRSPLSLVITASGVDKGELEPAQILMVDEEGRPVESPLRPSDETALHVTIARLREAGAVLHTHSPWNNILSELDAGGGEVHLEGHEMLKGLSGVKTHEHREVVPVLENSQDYPTLSRQVESLLGARPEIHGFLLRRHGLYTWGRDLAEARRHVEIFEFLFEVEGRLRTAGIGSDPR